MFVEQQQMVVRTLHRVYPAIVAFLQVSFDFPSRHAKHIELVLKTIELEHIGHGDVAGVNLVV